MDKSIYTESAWCRGWRDTKTAWTSWQFLLFDIFGGGVVALLSHLFAQQWFWGVVVAAAGLLGVWFGITFRTPIKQRNEARDRIVEFEKPDKNLSIREKLTDLWTEGLHLQIDHVEIDKPVPTEKVNDWILRVSSYVSEALGKDSLTILYTIDNSATPICNPSSKEHKKSVELIAQRMLRLMQFISELRNKSNNILKAPNVICNS